MHNAPAPAASGYRYTGTAPVEYIAPVEGWSLHFIVDDDSDGFAYREYIARGPERDVDLPVSRFAFHPTQERFAWLVRNGFAQKPAKHVTGPWDDHDIDYALAVEQRAVAA